jgi:hypothetical protein
VPVGSVPVGSPADLLLYPQMTGGANAHLGVHALDRFDNFDGLCYNLFLETKRDSKLAPKLSLDSRVQGFFSFVGSIWCLPGQRFAQIHK